MRQATGRSPASTTPSSEALPTVVPGQPWLADVFDLVQTRRQAGWRPRRLEDWTGHDAGATVLQGFRLAWQDFQKKQPDLVNALRSPAVMPLVALFRLPPADLGVEEAHTAFAALIPQLFVPGPATHATARLALVARLRQGVPSGWSESRYLTALLDEVLTLASGGAVDSLPLSSAVEKVERLFAFLDALPDLRKIDKADSSAHTRGAESPAEKPPAAHPDSTIQPVGSVPQQPSPGGATGGEQMPSGSARHRPAPGLGRVMSERLEAATQEIAATHGQQTASLFKDTMLRVVIESLGDYLDGAAGPVAGREASCRFGLTATEQELFEKLDQTEGRGAKARREAQQLILDYLPGQKITQALTHSLRDYLKSRDWGVRCKCGAAATIRWQKDDRLQKDEAPENRGAMVFSHLDEEGRHTQHGSFTTFPDKVTLVEHRDARRKSSM